MRSVHWGISILPRPTPLAAKSPFHIESEGPDSCVSLKENNMTSTPTLTQRAQLNFWQRHGLFLAVIAAYSAMAIPQLNHGLASLDGHGAVATVRKWADSHHITNSRPPGHPTSEFYLYGTIGFVLRALFNQPFTDSLYLWLQFLAGVATAFVFYEWLCKLDFSPGRAAGAVCCLVFSVQFLNNTIDGEEFVVAILFLVAALRLLTVGENETISMTRIYISMLCFALAVGCRPELLLAGVAYPIYFYLRPELGFKRYIKALPVQIGTGVLVWLPIMLSVHVGAPMGSGMSRKQALLGGGYKLLFQCFTLPVFALFCWTLATQAMKLRSHLRARFPLNFVLPISWLIAVVYTLLFFSYPAKPAYALVVVPFCVLLAAWQSQVLVTLLTVCTLLGLFVQVDIFKDRRLTAPHLKPGVYFEVTRQKSFYLLSYLRDLNRLCGASPTAIIAYVAPWDVEYHIARGDFEAQEQKLEGENTGVSGFTLPESHCVLMTSGAATGEWVQKLNAQGFSVTMDERLYRYVFEKYDFKSQAKTSATITNIPVSLFSVSSNP